MKPIELSFGQLALAASLLLVNGLLSWLLSLDLGRRLVLAALRATVQLALIGLVLQQVFELRQVGWILLVMAIMTLAAASASVRRAEHRYPGIWLNGLISVGVSAWLVTLIAVMAVVQVKPWYEPRYIIPLLGMILGNALNGISLGLERFSTTLHRRRAEVESRLAVGATRWEAARPLVAESVRAGMIPMINTLSVTGLVSLPGMMTGQLLAGADPSTAVKYQLMILFLIAAATALGTLLSVLLTWRRAFNTRHQFVFTSLTGESRS